MQNLAISYAAQILSTFDGTIDGKEIEQLAVPMSLEDFQVLEELLFGSSEEHLSMDNGMHQNFLVSLTAADMDSLSTSFRFH